MDFTQVVGFLVTMAAILYMFVKRAKDVHKSRHTHEEGHLEEHEQAERLQDFLKSLEVDMDESQDFKPLPKQKVSHPEPPPKPPEATLKPKPAYNQESFNDEFKFRSGLDNFQTKTNIDERKLKINIKNKYGADDYGEHLLSPEFRGEKIPELVGYRRASSIKRLIRSLPSKKDILLIHEVLDQPKGFKF